MNAGHARGRIADATLAAGATILLLYATTGPRGWVVGGIALVLLGAALLWATPRPALATRMMASIAGLLFAFSTALDGPGRIVAAGSGALLLVGVLAAGGRHR